MLNCIFDRKEPGLEPLKPVKVFDVYVDAYDENKKIVFIKVMRQVFGISLHEAKDFVESIPVKIAEKITLVVVDKIKRELESVGAMVRIEEKGEELPL